MTLNCDLIDTSTEELLIGAHEMRLGSSGICTAAGLNPYETPLELWSRMTGKKTAKEETLPMFLGKLLEPAVAACYSRHNPDVTVKKNAFSAVPKNMPWAVATPDYLCSVGNMYILECKTTNAYAGDYWAEGVPDYAHCQVQWQLGIWQMDRADVAVLIGGSEYKQHTVTFSRDVFDQLCELGDRFMTHVKTDTPLPARANDIEALKLRQPPAPGKRVAMTQEMAALCDQYDKLRDLRDAKKILMVEYQERLDDLRAQITQALGDAEIASNEQYEVKRTHKMRNGYTVPASNVETFKVKAIQQPVIED